jgi:hypothetical protein
MSRKSKYVEKNSEITENEYIIAETDASEEDTSIQVVLPKELSLSPDDLPTAITEQFDKIRELEEKVENAKESADNSKKRAQEISDIKVKLGNRTATIGELQQFALDISGSQNNIVAALDVSFKYQQQLGEITQYLFMLGVSDIVATKTVIDKLEAELKGTSGEKMSEFAKAEIISVIQQLKAQEKIAKRVERHDKKISKHEESIKENKNNITKLFETNERQDKLIVDLVERCSKQEQEIEDLKTKINQLETPENHNNKLIYITCGGTIAAFILSIIGLFI